MRVAPLPPAEAVRGAAARQPHAPQDPRRRRPRRADRRRRDRRGVDRRRRRTPTTGATRTCASRARSCAACTARSPRTGSRRPARCSPASATCPTLEPVGRRRPDAWSCARAPASATRTSRRSTTSRSPRRARRSTSPPPTSCRARRSSRRSQDAAERGVRVRVLVPGAQHRQGAGLARPAARPTTTCSTAGVRDLRVPPDDAAREDADRRRRWSSVGLGELRQPLVPAQRRGDAVRAAPRRSRRELTEQFERDLEVSERIEPERWRRPRAGPAGRRDRLEVRAARALTRGDPAAGMYLRLVRSLLVVTPPHRSPRCSTPPPPSSPPVP